jgi:hypothetical protein
MSRPGGRFRWILPSLALAGPVFPGLARADDEPPPAAAAPSPETQAALDEIRREAEQKKAEREAMQRLRREVDRKGASARRGARPPMTQDQIRAMRARQRQQVQRAFRGLPPLPGPPARRVPGTVRTFRTPNGGGFVGVWGIPIPMR